MTKKQSNEVLHLASTVTKDPYPVEMVWNDRVKEKQPTSAGNCFKESIPGNDLKLLDRMKSEQSYSETSILFNRFSLSCLLYLLLMQLSDYVYSRLF